MADKALAARLKSARESVGLSLTEASRRLGFPNYQTLSKIEEGERIVKAAELSTFARAYYSSVNQLLGIQEARPPAIFLWRSEGKNEERLEAESRISKHCTHYVSIEKTLGLPQSAGFPRLVKGREMIRTDGDVDDVASKACNLLNLGKRPACSLAKVLEQEYGVKLLYLPLSDAGSAASIVHPDWGAVITINSDEAPWRRAYDLGHELFHLLTWEVVMPEEKENASLHGDLEKKANRFASTLLLPDSEIQSELHKLLSRSHSISFSDLVDLAREFGVSTKALLYRMANLRFFTWERADELAKNEELSALDKKRRRADWGQQPRSERFDFLAVQCLRKGLISRGKFAEMVEIDRSDIDSFIEGYGLMGTEGGQVEIMAP
jgi:Zn-dependent peptidase ImmA (M78 family)/transcriptional regulator with XRE-family HTH domain